MGGHVGLSVPTRRQVLVHPVTRQSVITPVPVSTLGRTYTLGFMPGRGTPLACVRVPESLWRRFAEVARANGTDRSALIRAFIAWYLHEPGATLPDRP